MIGFDRGAHIDDGALIRLLDGEEDALPIRRHLESCSTCRDRLDALRDAGSQFDMLFAGSDGVVVPTYDQEFLGALEHASPGLKVPSRHRSSHAWAIAAAAAVATLILVTSPVGAWISDRISAFSSRAEAPVTPPVVVPSSRAAAGSEVATLVEGTSLILRLHAAELPDRIAVDRGNGTMASALVVNAAAPADMMVRPDGFDVTSNGGSLEVKIPSTIQNVEVRVGANVVARWPAATTSGLPWEYVTR